MSDDQKKVLIVEDEVHISKVYEVQLIKAGFLPIITRDGEDALKLFSSQKISLVILDIIIPKKDGFEVLEEIRKMSQVPVLIISNLSQEADRKRAVELGATEYLVKIDSTVQAIIDKIKFYLTQ